MKEPRLKTLNWKIISNIYPTKVFLEKIKKESTNICEMCDEIDYIEHFFFSCKKIKMIWFEIENYCPKIRYGYKINTERSTLWLP